MYNKLSNIFFQNKAHRKSLKEQESKKINARNATVAQPGRASDL